MRKVFPIVLAVLLSAALCPAVDMTYRLEYQIRGAAISRLLLVFPLRVYYEASAVLDLSAIHQPNGDICFSYTGIPRTAYILRTLGFSGKTLALLTVNGADGGASSFSSDLLSKWEKIAPEFSARVKTIKKFPHQLVMKGPQPFSFERDASGLYRNFVIGLEPLYRYHPAKTGIYFNVFPMLADLLKLLNHRFGPGQAVGSSDQYPAEWTGEALDFSDDLNRVAGLLEKAVKSMVTVQQKFPFRLRFRVGVRTAEEIEICGESFPDVPLWKGFMIREVFRRVRLRSADGMLLEDEIWVGIRNTKGQGGFGCLRLKAINQGVEKQ